MLLLILGLDLLRVFYTLARFKMMEEQFRSIQMCSGFICLLLLLLEPVQVLSQYFIIKLNLWALKYLSQNQRSVLHKLDNLIAVTTIINITLKLKVKHF